MMTVLETLTDTVPGGESVFDTGRIVISGGSDSVIKVWRLDLEARRVGGIHLVFTCLFEVHHISIIN
jgi:hypothetical protein